MSDIIQIHNSVASHIMLIRLVFKHSINLLMWHCLPKSLQETSFQGENSQVEMHKQVLIRYFIIEIAL